MPKACRWFSPPPPPRCPKRIGMPERRVGPNGAYAGDDVRRSVAQTSVYPGHARAVNWSWRRGETRRVDRVLCLNGAAECHSAAQDFLVSTTDGQCRTPNHWQGGGGWAGAPGVPPLIGLCGKSNPPLVGWTRSGAVLQRRPRHGTRAACRALARGYACLI